MEDDATLDQEADDHQTVGSAPALQQVITDSQSRSTAAASVVHTTTSPSHLLSDEPSRATSLTHSFPPESSVSRNLTKFSLPHKSSPEVLSSIENTGSGGLKPSTGPIQDRHSSASSSARDAKKKSSLTGTPLDHSSTSQHSHTQVAHSSTAKNHHLSSADSRHPSSYQGTHRKQSQEPNYDSSTTELHQNKPSSPLPSSPQEESWVKQLFVARERDQQTKQLDESEKRQFASGSAKFTTLVEDPTSEGAKGRESSSQKAGVRWLKLF